MKNTSKWDWQPKDTIKVVVIVILIILTGWVSAKYSAQRNLWKETSGVYEKLNSKKLHPGKYVVMFYKKDCVYCQKAMPIVQKEFTKKASNVTFYKVDANTKNGKKLAGYYSVTSTPTMVTFRVKHGKISSTEAFSITKDLRTQRKGHIKSKDIHVKKDLIHKLMQGQEIWND